jgi:hypothetical protein
LTIKQVFDACKSRDFDAVRKWINENSDQDSAAIFQSVYNNSGEYVQKKSVPEMIVIIADYQYKASFVTNHEINLLAFFVELMMRLEWK